MIIEWNTKQKRCYQRIMSGLQYAQIKSTAVRFITLTTSFKGSNRSLYRDFRCLKYRIKRRFGVFEYLKVNTNEGYGVIHLIYKGAYIPQKWLSHAWSEIHNSPVVDIRFMRGGSNGLGSYVVSQYLSDQRTSFIRYSWSWGWVYCGFVGYWKKIIREYFFKDGLRVWHKHLSGLTIRLEGKYLKPPPDVKLVYYMQYSLEGDSFPQFIEPDVPQKRKNTIHRCDKCHAHNVKGRFILGQAICYECYAARNVTCHPNIRHY